MSAWSACCVVVAVSVQALLLTLGDFLYAVYKRSTSIVSGVQSQVPRHHHVRQDGRVLGVPFW